MLTVHGALGKPRGAARVRDGRRGEGVDRDVGPRVARGSLKRAPVARGIRRRHLEDPVEIRQVPGAAAHLGRDLRRRQEDRGAAILQHVGLFRRRQGAVHAHPERTDPLGTEERDHDVDVVGKTGRHPVPLAPSKTSPC